MKKVIFASSVAVLAFAMIAGAQGVTFKTNLTIGSTGSDVVALQTWLMTQGYSIPAIASGAAAKGYFGSQTQAAVKAYQAAVGVPATGFFGPLTQAKVNAGSTASNGGTVAMGCPAGYTCVLNPGTTPTTPAPGATLSMDGTDGSITLSSSSYVSTSQTLKKGDMNKPIISATMHATAGNVAVSRFDVHFSARPWLLFGSLNLVDQTGKVLATKTLSSAADATEVTVGSDYLVRFDGVNAVVSPNTDVTFIVTANVLAASDKISGQTITVSIPSGSIRTINGKGYTDSLGFASGSNSLTLSSSGSTGDLYTRVSPLTPDTQTLNVSSTNVTEGVTLGTFDVKLQNQGGTINSLNFQINNNKSFNAPTLMQNVRLYDGSTLLGGAYTLSNSGLATFVNLNIPLTQDIWKSLTLKADVLATSTSFSASSTIVASSVVGVDNNYGTLTLSNASNRTSNDSIFVPNAGISITGITPVKGNVTQPTNGVWLAAYPSITFTINNTGNNPIYISKNASVALATTTSAGAAASTTVSSVSASGSTTGDTSFAYIINGSRTFTYNFTVDNTNGSTAAKKISITQINYGLSGADDTNDSNLNVNYGLNTAFVQVP